MHRGLGGVSGRVCALRRGQRRENSHVSWAAAFLNANKIAPAFHSESKKVSASTPRRPLSPSRV